MTASSGRRTGALFHTTRWSMVLRARDDAAPDDGEAMGALCRTYWYPLYALVRRLGRSPHDAQDLTQEFFARLLAGDWLKAAARDKGRFRTFLCVAMKRFLANDWDRRRARKRGGGSIHVPLDAESAERRYHDEPVDAMSADRIYERRWALTLLQEAMARLRDDYAAQGKQAEFDALKDSLTAERGAIPYAAKAAAMGISEGAARVAVHRLRRRYREVFRLTVADTVAGEGEIEEEMRHIAAVLGQG